MALLRGTRSFASRRCRAARLRSAAQLRSAVDAESRRRASLLATRTSAVAGTGQISAMRASLLDEFMLERAGRLTSRSSGRVRRQRSASRVANCGAPLSSRSVRRHEADRSIDDRCNLLGLVAAYASAWTSCRTGLPSCSSTRRVVPSLRLPRSTDLPLVAARGCGCAPSVDLEVGRQLAVDRWHVARRASGSKQGTRLG